ncbi:MAG TPA: PDZ domain-containing protein [Verrucomicrobiota bacterium]|nr:PDZ domain-containing protein [Verrucomicrobiota bacterium]HNU49745.1 PDZ domain-containing protein [Verrucomicrobiota bacterium]
MRNNTLSWSSAIALAAWATAIGVPNSAAAGPIPEKVAHLGIAVGPLDDTLREQLKLGRGMGLRVERVLDDSPAGKAGVKIHDVLQKLEDQILFNAAQLTALVRSHEPGDKVALGLIRQGEPCTLEVTLGETEARDSLLPEGWDPFSNPQLRNLLGRNLDRARDVYEEALGRGKPVAFLGVELAPVEAALTAQLGLEREAGALIETVAEESPAAKAGLQRHDVVVGIDGQRVKSPADLSERIRGHQKGDQVVLEILRGGKAQKTEVVLSEKAATDPLKLRSLFKDYRVLPEIKIVKPAPGVGGVIVDLRSDREGDALGREHRVIIREEGPKKGGAVRIEAAPDQPRVRSTERRVIVIKTDEGTTTTVTEKDGQRSVVVKDAKDKVVFEGPANSDEERQKLPRDAREAIERLEQRLEKLPEAGGGDVLRELRIPPPPSAPDVVYRAGGLVGFGGRSPLAAGAGEGQASFCT